MGGGEEAGLGREKGFEKGGGLDFATDCIDF